MMPMRMPGISSPRRVTVLLMFLRTCVRQGYMLPVVSKEKTTSTAGLLMVALREKEWGDYPTERPGCNLGKRKKGSTAAVEPGRNIPCKKSPRRDDDRG